MVRSPSNNAPMTQNQVISLGVMAAVGALMVYYMLRPSARDNNKKEDVKAAVKSIEDDSYSSKTKKSKSATKIAPGTTGARGTTSRTTGDVDATPLTSNVKDEKALHQEIEKIDKRGKVLFKNKQFMEAAEVFTEALDLIDKFGGGDGDDDNEGGGAGAGAARQSNSLKRQIITLTNNRSAMYEKAALPDLALHDCDTILEQDLGHTKARTRRLRILESQKRYEEALVEVCALQLKFVQDNRESLRMGMPITPPVPQTKLEELMGHLLPEEIEKQSKRLLENNQKGGQQRLPSKHTILQLLQSFTGYNTWMSAAARDGSVDKITSELEAIGDNEKEKQVTLLVKRGRRHAFDRSFEKAKVDFEAAYKLSEEDDSIKDKLDDKEYAHLLEWVAMARHLKHDLTGALDCYERCSDLQPTNAEILVKRAGVQMDAGKQDEALKLFETALGLDPDAVDALLHRANLRMLQQKPEEAKVDLNRCLQLRPDHLLARLRLATILMATNETAAAKKELQMAESLDPDSSEVHSYWGEMYFAEGEWADAKERFEKAIKADPTNPTPYVNAALVMMNTPTPGGVPDVAEATRLFEKAIEVDPTFHAAYVHLGQLKLSMATEITKARQVVALYDKGLEYCRTPEEMKDICSMRILTVAQVDAAGLLKMETLNMQ